MLNLCASDFSECAVVEQLTEADDGFGGKISTWSQRTELWAMVEDKSGGEGELNGRIEAVESVELTTQFRDDIQTTDRVLLEGVYYNISRLEDVKRKRRYLKIYASSQVTS